MEPKYASVGGTETTFDTYPKVLSLPKSILREWKEN